MRNIYNVLQLYSIMPIGFAKHWSFFLVGAMSAFNVSRGVHKTEWKRSGRNLTVVDPRARDEGLPTATRCATPAPLHRRHHHVSIIITKTTH